MRIRAALSTALCAAALATAATPTSPYREEIARWRVEREARLKGDGGWLSVAGLFWLEEPGSRTFGTGPGVDIQLPAGSTAPRAGTLTFSGKDVEVRLEPGVEARVGGQPLTAPRILNADTSAAPDVLQLGRLTVQLIERSGKYGLRVKDPEAPQRRAFQGLQWYPVEERWRVTAKWVPSDPPRTVPITNVLGQVSDLPSPGRAVFTVDGREVTLEPVLEAPGDDKLFFIFRDETAPRETYGAGRFLYSAMPEDGQVVLDFNKAYSPPCAFTQYATCPLPPRQNRLPVKINAGEKDPKLLH
jgi:uncharacterized protein (DUF1684 family)